MALGGTPPPKDIPELIAERGSTNRSGCDRSYWLAARKDHRCVWRDRADALQAELKVALDQLREKTGLLDEKIDALNQKMFGRRSEYQRVPDINAEIRKQHSSDLEQAEAKRRIPPRFLR